jgi:hypothetical protein
LRVFFIISLLVNKSLLVIIKLSLITECCACDKPLTSKTLMKCSKIRLNFRWYTDTYTDVPLVCWSPPEQNKGFVLVLIPWPNAKILIDSVLPTFLFFRVENRIPMEPSSKIILNYNYVNEYFILSAKSWKWKQLN